MKLNEKIAYYRREKKLSQEELAAQVGVSRQAVSKWELGDASPDVNKLLALSKAFGISTDHLLDETRLLPRPRRRPLRRRPPRRPDRGSLTICLALLEKWSAGGAGWPGSTSPSRGRA